jgi:hypothetical protein
MWLSTWARVDDLMLAEGAISADEIDTARKAYVDPTFSYRDALVVSTWGRRPR